MLISFYDYLQQWCMIIADDGITVNLTIYYLYVYIEVHL